MSFTIIIIIIIVLLSLLSLLSISIHFILCKKIKKRKKEKKSIIFTCHLLWSEKETQENKSEKVARVDPITLPFCLGEPRYINYTPTPFVEFNFDVKLFM